MNPNPGTRVQLSTFLKWNISDIGYKTAKDELQREMVVEVSVIEFCRTNDINLMPSQFIKKSFKVILVISSVCDKYFFVKGYVQFS